MDGIITRAQAEDFSDSSSDDDNDDDTDYLKDIYGHYGGSLIPSAKSEQNSSSKSGGNPDEKNNITPCIELPLRALFLFFLPLENRVRNYSLRFSDSAIATASCFLYFDSNGAVYTPP